MFESWLKFLQISALLISPLSHASQTFLPAEAALSTNYLLGNLESSFKSQNKDKVSNSIALIDTFFNSVFQHLTFKLRRPGLNFSESDFEDVKRIEKFLVNMKLIFYRYQQLSQKAEVYFETQFSDLNNVHKLMKARYTLPHGISNEPFFCGPLPAHERN